MYLNDTMSLQTVRKNVYMMDFQERDYQEFIDWIVGNSDFYLFEIPAKDESGELKLMKFVNRIDITIKEYEPIIFENYEEDNILSHAYERG